MKTAYLKTKVAGVSFENRQQAISYLRNRKGVYFQLIREANNTYDKNAVRIIAKTIDKQVYDIGYIPKEINAIVAKALDENKTCFVKRYGYTGGYNDHVSHGVQVEIIYGK